MSDIPATDAPTPEVELVHEEMQDFKEPVDPKTIPKKVSQNVASRKAVDEILEMAMSEPSYKELMTDHFWEVLRDKAIAKVGLPGAKKKEVDKAKITPLDDDAARSFLREEMEDGQFIGKRVRDLIAKGHTDYLRAYAFSPTLFRKRLQRLFARGTKNLNPDESKKEKKKVGSKAPQEKPKEKPGRVPPPPPPKKKDKSKKKSKSKSKKA